MRLTAGLLYAGGLIAVVSLASAQPPGQPPGKEKGRKGFPGGPGGGSSAVTTDEVVAQMMAFDKNGDGKLTKDEVSDARLHRLFDRADADKDGVVTRDELTKLFAKELAAAGPGFDGPGGFGPPPGGGPPRPGQVMPPFLREMLGLTPEQREKMDAVQKEVDASLDKILTPEQRKQLAEMRGGGGFGPGGPPRGRPPMPEKE